VNKSAFSKEAIEKMNQALKNNTPPKPLAELHTIHGSKGMEWDNVIITKAIHEYWDNAINRDLIKLPKNLIQHQDITEHDKIEEERRLFYPPRNFRKSERKNNDSQQRQRRFQHLAV
jgi:superfamily I DNA/RNA helicase